MIIITCSRVWHSISGNNTGLWKDTIPARAGWQQLLSVQPILSEVQKTIDWGWIKSCWDGRIWWVFKTDMYKPWMTTPFQEHAICNICHNTFSGFVDTIQNWATWCWLLTIHRTPLLETSLQYSAAMARRYWIWHGKINNLGGVLYWYSRKKQIRQDTRG